MGCVSDPLFGEDHFSLLVRGKGKDRLCVRCAVDHGLFIIRADDALIRLLQHETREPSEESNTGNGPPCQPRHVELHAQAVDRARHCRPEATADAGRGCSSTVQCAKDALRRGRVGENDSQ